MTATQKEIVNILLNEYGLLAVVKPFGENERNNVFLAESGEKAFIVKLEDAENLEQVKLSIAVAAHLLKSEVLSSSRFLQTNTGAYFAKWADKILTVQIKENLEPLSPKADKDFISLGEVLGEFHQLLRNEYFENIGESDFYGDFMSNEIPLAQTAERLDEIKEFYRRHSPDKKQLTVGIIHNDLNLGNLFKAGKKHFFLDFEHLKRGPLVSDLGVLALELWEHEKGVPDYTHKLSLILEGYEGKSKLSEYDKRNIVIYSLRYLYSDENLYHYWFVNGNKDAAKYIPQIKEKQNLLLTQL